jgi:hypothetical protein
MVCASYAPSVGHAVCAAPILAECVCPAPAVISCSLPLRRVVDAHLSMLSMADLRLCCPLRAFPPALVMRSLPSPCFSTFVVAFVRRHVLDVLGDAGRSGVDGCQLSDSGKMADERRSGLPVCNLGRVCIAVLATLPLVIDGPKNKAVAAFASKTNGPQATAVTPCTRRSPATR